MVGQVPSLRREMASICQVARQHLVAAAPWDAICNILIIIVHFFKTYIYIRITIYIQNYKYIILYILYIMTYWDKYWNSVWTSRKSHRLAFVRVRTAPMPGDADASRVKDVKRWNDSKNQRHFFSNGWRCEKMYQESRARAYTWYNIIIDYILLLHCMVCLRHCVQTLFVLKVIRAALFCGNRIWNAWKSCIGRQWRGFAALFFGLSWSLIWILPIWLKPYDPQTTKQGPVNKDLWTDLR